MVVSVNADTWSMVATAKSSFIPIQRDIAFVLPICTGRSYLNGADVRSLRTFVGETTHQFQEVSG